MLSKRSLEGELEIDHRESPGIGYSDLVTAPKEFQQAPIVGKGEHYECATYSCKHCQAVVILNPLRTRERHYCPYCDRYVCDNPVCVMMTNGTLKHRTMQEVFDEMIAVALLTENIQEV